MRSRLVFSMLAIVLIASLVLTACQAPATPATSAPTAAPIQPTAIPPTQPPAVSPTTAPAAFTPQKIAAPDCNYGTADIPALLKSVEAVDANTVVFALCKPDPAFASKITVPAFAILSAKAIEANGGDSLSMSVNPVGTGPYMLKEWVHGDHITLTANPYYWGQPAKTTDLIFRWSSEAAQRLLELQAGTVDGMDNPAPEDYATIQNDPNLKLHARQPTNDGYLGFNNTMKPFDDPKVRQALAMAIDRQRIVDNFYPEGSIVAEQFIPPTLKPGYTDGAKWYDYNPTEAKKLLADAGFPNGFETTLSYRNVVRTYLPSPDKVAQEVQAELAQVGVKATLNEEESAKFLDDLAAGLLPMFLLGGNADYADSSNLYDYTFATATNKKLGDLYPDLVAELKAAEQVSDPAARQVHYDKANDLIKEHVPLVTIAYGVSATAFKASVEGAHASPVNKEIFAVMSSGSDQLVWMQNGEPASLVCWDESDDETTRACYQIYDTLVSFKPGTAEMAPNLAESWEANADATVWTFHLRQGVKFNDGTTMDASDVIATFDTLWDAKNPNHKGRIGAFEYFSSFMGSFLNVK
ncbi:MAG: ABC transporter substrate-binding protein [Chloroflexi bacterium]|nr:ABC transporter substrate-binding protein [Chloroflexota bacterium]